MKDLTKKVFHGLDARVVKRKILVGLTVGLICFMAPSLLNRAMGLTQTTVETTMKMNCPIATVEDGVNHYAVTNRSL